MRQSSSSPSSSSIPPASSVSFFERYEKMFHCGGCIADDEHEPVSSAIIYQQSSDERDEQQSNQFTEATSNYWSSYNKARRHQESPPVVTVTYNQASYDEIDKFDIDERKSKRQSKSKTAKGKAHAQTEPVNEYFNGIQKLPYINNSNSNQPEIQMQQRRQQKQHYYSTPIKSNTSTMKSPFSSSSPKSTKRLHYDMLKDMLLANNYRSSSKGDRYLNSNSLTQTDSDLTQSTQSLSESEDDISWGPIDEEQQSQEQPQEQDTLVSILRRKVKLGILLESKNTKTTDKKNRVRVRFDKDTKFPDPNEIPSPTRKHGSLLSLDGCCRSVTGHLHV